MGVLTFQIVERGETLSDEDQKKEEPQVEQDDAAEEQEPKSKGDLSSRIAGWALNEIAQDIENERQSAEDALKSIAQYQLSLAMHKIADRLGDIEVALLEIAGGL